ncbi:MAG TPA: hypothetical protein VGP99_00305, partial [Tepidisphaeraceae bacterium]|nr:hypothetical protein [Tepidisphaeraceae bacterium]
MDFDALKHSDSLARQRLDHEKNAIDRDVKKSFEQAAWLAESVFDAAQIGIQEEFKKINDRIAEELKSVDEIEQTAASLMLLYCQKPPPDEELREAETVPAAVGTASADAAAPATSQLPSPSTPGDGQGEGSAAGGETLQSFYNTQHQLAEQLINRLNRLKSPKVFIGATPYVFAFIVIVAAVIIGHWMKDSLSNPDLNIALWSGGIGLVAALVFGFLLRLLAKSQIKNTYIPLRRSLRS